MPIHRPFYRICRPFVNGHYATGGTAKYIEGKEYAKSPERFTRAFLVLQKDLINLFDYIEPADINLDTFSYRISELILRSCIEFESNCKAILIENGYPKRPEDYSILDYRKIELSHRLSSYKVRFPYWIGNKNIRIPFLAWKNNGRLDWYQTYNDVKHNRKDFFEQANLNIALDAICGLLVILSAQFYTYDFASSVDYLITEGPGDGFEPAIGSYFQTFFPDDWPVVDRYDFSWYELSEDEKRFQKYSYPI